MMIKSKKLICIALSALLAAGIFAGCGKKATNSGGLTENTAERPESNPDATPYAAESVPHQFEAEGDNIKPAEGGGVDVAVEPREGDDQYDFDDEDLGFVDTMSGALISVGMSMGDIESLIGGPKTVDSQGNRFYSGIAIQYDSNNKASRLVVAAGNMEGSDDPERFVTPHGVKLGSSLDEFISVYGDDYNKPEDENNDVSITRAARYYKQDGDDFTYVGSDFSGDQVPPNDSTRVTQTFLFAPETGAVSVISIERGTDA